jgi:asparagine synthetase B (glutamine-hydrolysing)
VTECRAHGKREKKHHRKWDAADGGAKAGAGTGTGAGVPSEEGSTAGPLPSAMLAPGPDLREPYVSRCRVLLVGIGADEQLAGYGRHQTVHRKDVQAAAEAEAGAVADAISAVSVAEAEEGTGAGAGGVASAPPPPPMTLLEQELDKDVTRLWKRNLGR